MTRAKTLSEIIQQLPNIDILRFCQRLYPQIEPGEWGSRSLYAAILERETFGIYKRSTIKYNWGASLENAPNDALTLIKISYLLHRLLEDPYVRERINSILRHW